MKYKNLEFLGVYKEKLKNGEKTITIRIVKPNLKVGDIFLAHSGGKVIGKFRVKNIYIKRIKEITDEEAKKDGYNSKEELINDLKKYYKNLKEDNYIYIIEFEPLEIFKEEISSEEFAWGGKIDVIDLAKKILEYDDKLKEKEKEFLKILIESGSIRKAAMKLGGLNKRNIFRKILRKGLKRLREKGII